MSDSSDDHHDGDSDSDNDLFDDSRRRHNRQRARDEAIYGVFYDDDNHDSYMRNSNRRRGGGRSGDDGLNIAPQFVKGKKQVGEDEEEEEDEDMFEAPKKQDDEENDKEDDNEISAAEKMKQAEEDERETQEEIARQDELRKQQDAANDYFMNLLKRGKGEKVSSVAAKASASHQVEKSSSVASSSAGLVFHHADASSGVAGLGFSKASSSDNQQTINKLNAPSFMGQAGLGMRPGIGPGMQPGAGLGMAGSASGVGLGAASAGLGMPTSFGGSNKHQTKPEPTFVKDPNLGSWEKHTKGIGMKLLAKMGYKGSGGLGSKRLKKKTVVDESTGQAVEVEAPAKKGISRPVEVVVRPNNLGLGYGNFKEATKLKNNQQIEAEVRGIDLKKKQKEEEAKRKKAQESSTYSTQPTESSALPSVQDLMQQKAWKRGVRQSQKARKKQKRTIIPYQELLEKQSSQPSVIIDMRGPSATAPTSGDGQPTEVPLAEELLHNLSLLLNTYENKVHSCSHFVRSSKQKVESLQSEISNLEEQQKQTKDRVKKLNKVLETIDKIEAIVNGKSRTHNSDDVAAVQALVKELESSFTQEEQKKLRFFEVMAPSLMEPVILSRLERWDPLQSEVANTKSTMESIVSFCKDYPSPAASRQDAGSSMMRAMFTNLLLPRVKKSLESQQWDPINDVEIGLQLYENLCHVATQIAPSATPENSNQTDNEHHILPPDDDDEMGDVASLLKNLVKDEIIHQTVYFKLARALSQWKPTLDESGTGLADRPSLWILPWIPYLDHRSILPTLLADCKRKLKSAISLLQKNIGDHETFCQASLQALAPWCAVFPKESLPSIMSTSVVTRLASAVASAASSAFKSQSAFPSLDWSSIVLTCEMHSSGLLSNKEFLSIIEGELMSRWLTRMQAWLFKEPSQWKEAAEVYITWRVMLFSKSSDLGKYPASQKCLAQDVGICSLFYAALLIIQAAQASKMDVLDDLRPSATNLRAVLARRSREEQEEAQAELLRMEATGVASSRGALQDPGVEARVRAAQRHQGHTPTFREVVEEFAREHDILFQPRMGNNATKDGKPVFLFGSIPVYLDLDVVFVFQNSEWRPTSLAQLAMMAKEK